jgi:hypothetical protein
MEHWIEDKTHAVGEIVSRVIFLRNCLSSPMDALVLGHVEWLGANPDERSFRFQRHVCGRRHVRWVPDEGDPKIDRGASLDRTPGARLAWS